MPSNLETELKFLLTPEAADRLARRRFGRAKRLELASVYYDTAEQKLRKAGFTLRLRRNGEAWVQTLKGHASGGVSRFEKEIAARQGSLDLSVLSQLKLSPSIQAPDLEPVFETQVTRYVRIWKRDRAEIELALDIGEITCQQRREPILELELELLSGDPSALFKAGRALSKSGGLSICPASKSARGFALAAAGNDKPTRFAPPQLPGEASAADVLLGYSFAALRQFEANARALQLRPSVESLHQCRVALRRLRASLNAFKPILNEKERRPLQIALSRLTDRFAAAREIDVFIATSFRPFASHSPGMAEFGRLLRASQTRARKDAIAVAKSDATSELLLALTEWLVCGAWNSGEHAVAPFSELAPKLLNHRRKRMLRRGRKLDWDSAAARHGLRIEAKKMRYLAETCRDWTPHADEMIRALSELQDALGDLNDMACASAIARSALPAQVSGEVMFAAGRIVGARLAGEAATLQKARRLFKDFEAMAEA